jgi:amino acid adenylation domain-containing protein
MQAASIEDTYPLSPLQEGMLFHRLVAHDSGVEIFQAVVSMPEELEAAALRQAWQRIVDRYSIYRTSFHWQGSEPPVQQVHRQARLEWREEDWRGASPAEQEALLERFLQADRARGVDLQQPPLIRMALFRLADAAWTLVWTAYHGVVDGRSSLAVLIEAFATHEALQRGEEPASLPVEPFRRYVEWLGRQDLAAAEAYWKRLLAGFRAPTPLAMASLARRRQASRDAHGDRQLLLPEATTAALGRLCEELDVTFHTLLQAAWALLLSRYSGTGDVVFGGVKSNRAAVPGGHRIVGPLINTVAVRATMPAGMRLDALLQQLRAQWLAHRPHEFVPLGQVQQWSEVASETRLFESLLVFENYSWSDALRGRGGAWAHRQVTIRRQPEYPLTLFGFKAQGLVMKLIYDRRAFDAATIVRMLGHLETLLGAAAGLPAPRPPRSPRPLRSSRRLKLDELPLLAAEEQAQLLHEWNDTAIAGPAPPLAPDLIAAHAAAAPGAPAVACGAERLSFAELVEQANRLAHHLRGLGVLTEALVGLHLDRGLDLLPAILGIWGAGGAFVPLPPDHPPRRLAYILEDARIEVVVTRAELAGALLEHQARLVCLDADAAAIAGCPAGAPPAAVSDEGLAYALYTSGSTGRPKGTLVSHAGLAHYLRFCHAAYPLAGGAPVFTSLSFDLTLTSLLAPLTAGLPVTLLPGENAFELLAAMLRSPLPSAAGRGAAWGFVKLTPSHLEVLGHELAPAELTGRSQALLLGGEALRFEQLAPWRDHAPATRLFNEYGPTEAVVGCAVHELQGGEPRTGPVPIGRPIAGARIYVLGATLEPMPAGCPGELCVAGPGLARGYLGRSDLTAERFVPDPFSPSPGGRLYRTGDRARHRADGVLQFLGRLDQQVKIRGNRVEPGEIEANLLQHPAVREAVVVLHERGQQQQLVAYCSTSLPAPGTATQELGQFLRQRLPAHMVPAAFVVLDGLPRTPHGKVDRRALPVPAELFVAAGAYAAPRTGAELAVAGVWQQVLGLERVGLDDNFYEVGGHSLALIRTREALRLLFDPDLRMVDLMENPTVRLQAERLSRAPRRRFDAEPAFAEPGAAPEQA